MTQKNLIHYFVNFSFFFITDGKRTPDFVRTVRNLAQSLVGTSAYTSLLPVWVTWEITVKQDCWLI